jgi:putative oxidoreductase
VAHELRHWKPGPNLSNPDEGQLMVRQILKTESDPSLAFARLLIGAVFFAHGAQKALGWFGGDGLTATLQFFGSMGIPAPVAFLPIAAEFFGGLGLILGCLARIAAGGILCDMAVAVAMVHGKIGFFMNWSGQQSGEGYEYHLLAIALAAIVSSKGAGAFSIDRFLVNRFLDAPKHNTRREAQWRSRTTTQADAGKI